MGSDADVDMDDLHGFHGHPCPTIILTITMALGGETELGGRRGDKGRSIAPFTSPILSLSFDPV